MTTGFEIFCLVILCLGLTMVVYGLVWLHGIPHHIAEANNHPHKRTIHIACWLSVFTLHAIWPLVYLWAIMPGKSIAVSVDHPLTNALTERVADLERRLAALSVAPTALTAPTAPTMTAKEN